MNIKLTCKDLYSGGSKVVRIGYCGAQYLLRGLDRLGYNRGSYGWNWDAYDIGGGVIVCTGYRNLIGDTIKRGEVERLNNAACLAVSYGGGLTYEQQQEKLRELRAELVSIIKGGAAV